MLQAVRQLFEGCQYGAGSSGKSSRRHVCAWASSCRPLPLSLCPYNIEQSRLEVSQSIVVSCVLLKSTVV